MGRIGSAIRDKRVLRLIGKFLRCGALVEGVVTASQEGTPHMDQQRGPLSPLLANIYLDALDKELDKRGLSFCRYADDGRRATNPPIHPELDREAPAAASQCR
jgi:retron-type reverse transcriptase